MFTIRERPHKPWTCNKDFRSSTGNGFALSLLERISARGAHHNTVVEIGLFPVTSEPMELIA
jgi:hypothetical protein